MKNWEDFDVFEGVVDMYLPPEGEGDTMASQAVTAVNKIVYKWFNDGDVYDNTYYLEGWGNDLSSYANWLDDHVKAARRVLRRIGHCLVESEYTELLYDLCEAVFDPKTLAGLNEFPRTGSIYQCEGPYRFEEPEEDGGWW